jgi:hypothetical protein
LISIRWNYFVVSSSKPAGRPTEAAAAADASKLYVRAVMRLGHARFAAVTTVGNIFDLRR